MRAPLLLVCLAAGLAILVAIVNPDVHMAPGLNQSSVASAAPAPASGVDAAIGQLVLARCGGCHGLQVLSGNPKDRDGWQKTVALMRNMGAQVSDQESNEIVDYLTRHFPVSGH